MAVNATSDAWTISGQTSTDWLRRITVGRLGTKLGSTLTDFPIRVDIPSSYWATVAPQAAGEDLVIVAADGTVRDFEVEKYDASGVTTLHYRVPTYTAAIATEYDWLYWGNAGLGASLANATGVWDANFSGVWHLGEASGALADSTGNGNTGTNNGAAYGATGQIDGALDFEASDSDFVAMGDVLDFEKDEPFSLSAWTKREDTTAIHTIISKMLSSGTFRGYLLWWHSSDYLQFVLRTDNSGSKMILVRTQATWDDTDWHHVAATYDGSEAVSGVTLYVDGVAQDLTTTFDALDGTTLSAAPFNIGARNSSTSHFDGIEDEARVSDSERSADWIAAEYLSGLDALTTLGEEQSLLAGMLRHPGMTGRMQELRGGMVA